MFLLFFHLLHWILSNFTGKLLQNTLTTFQCSQMHNTNHRYFFSNKYVSQIRYSRQGLELSGDEQNLLLPSRIYNREVNKICTYGIFKEKGARKAVQVKCYGESEEEEMTSSFYGKRSLSVDRTHELHGPLLFLLN